MPAPLHNLFDRLTGKGDRIEGRGLVMSESG